MVIGCLGSVVFSVSADQVKTISEMSWNSGAKYATHALYAGLPRREFVGLQNDEISIDVTLSRDYGVDPMKDIEQLFRIERNAEAVVLILGDKAYGIDKWNIESTKRKITRFDGRGNIREAVVTLNLTANIQRQEE